MCLVAIAHLCLADAPLALAANREEAYARQGTPPEPWRLPHPMVAGRDPRAGGTWLGVGPGGLLAAVTNRPPMASRGASRGHLCRDLLAAPDAARASALAVAELSKGRHGGCNVLVADSRTAWVVHGGERVGERRLAPGIHLLAEGDVDDPGDRRQTHVRSLLAAGAPADAAAWLAYWPPLLGRHGAGESPAICRHHQGGGTISADVITLGSPARWLHAQGPPCEAGFTDCSALLAAL